MRKSFLAALLAAGISLPAHAADEEPVEFMARIQFEHAIVCDTPELADAMVSAFHKSDERGWWMYSIHRGMVCSELYRRARNPVQREFPLTCTYGTNVAGKILFNPVTYRARVGPQVYTIIGSRRSRYAVSINAAPPHKLKGCMGSEEE